MNLSYHHPRENSRIAILGPRGSFTEEAARFFFLPEELVAYGSIPDCLEALEGDRASGAVVPIENSIEGSVNLTLDGLSEQSGSVIVAELSLPIEQHVMGVRVWAHDEVTRIYSHPQAVAQSRRFLRKTYPQAEIVYTQSTSEAAKWVSQHASEPWLAIGTRLAASLYRLQILHHSVQDYDNNRTRFVVVSRNHELLQEKERELPTCEKIKTSLRVTLPEDFPGALYQVLAAFSWRKLNLTRIESRPTKRELGNYHFFIDLEGGAGDVLVQGALSEIAALGCEVKLFGSYPCYVK